MAETTATATAGSSTTLSGLQTTLESQLQSAGLLDMEGWLTKEGNNIKNWKRRWFTVERNFLLYFDNPDSATPKRAVKLRDIRNPRPCADRGKEFCFQFDTPKRVFYAFADSAAEMDRWVSTLKKVSEIYRTYIEPAPTAEEPVTLAHPVRLCTSDSFQDLKMNTHLHIVIKVYADWCQSCTDMSPAYEAAARAFLSAGVRNIVFAQLDADRNDLNPRFFSETAIPIVKVFPCGDMNAPPQTFPAHAERTPLGFVQFVCRALGTQEVDMRAVIANLPADDGEAVDSSSMSITALGNNSADVFGGEANTEIHTDADTAGGTKTVPSIVEPAASSSSGGLTVTAPAERKNSTVSTAASAPAPVAAPVAAPAPASAPAPAPTLTVSDPSGTAIPRSPSPQTRGPAPPLNSTTPTTPAASAAAAPTVASSQGRGTPPQPQVSQRPVSVMSSLNAGAGAGVVAGPPPTYCELKMHKKASEVMDFQVSGKASKSEFFQEFTVSKPSGHVNRKWAKRSPMKPRMIRSLARATFGAKSVQVVDAEGLTPEREQAYKSLLHAIINRASGTGTGLSTDEISVSESVQLEYVRKVFGVAPEMHAAEVETAQKAKKVDEPNVTRLSVEVTVKAARNLVPKGARTGGSQSNDAFVTVGLVNAAAGGESSYDAAETFSTPMVRSLNPVWENQVFQLFDKKGTATHVVIEIWNENTGSRDVTEKLLKREKNDFLGRVTIPIDVKEAFSEKWMPLQKRSKRSHVGGDILLNIRSQHTLEDSAHKGSVVRASEQDIDVFETIDGLLVEYEYRSHFDEKLKEAGGVAGATIVQCRGDVCTIVPRGSKLPPKENANNEPVDAVAANEWDAEEEKAAVALWTGEIPLVGEAILKQWALQHGISFPQRTAVRFCSLSREYVAAGLSRKTILDRVNDMLSSNLEGLLSPGEQSRLGRAVEAVHTRFIGEITRVREQFDPSDDERGATAQLDYAVKSCRAFRALHVWATYHSESEVLTETLTTALRKSFSRMFRLMRRMAQMENNAAGNAPNPFQQLTLMVGYIADEMILGRRCFHTIFAEHNVDYCSLAYNKFTGLLMVEAQKAIHSVGTEVALSGSVFEFYYSVLKLYETADQVFAKLDAPSPNSEEPSFTTFHTLFTPCVLEWLTTCRKKTAQWISLAIAEDNYSRVANRSYSSSVVDIFTCFDQILDFIRSLKWPNPTTNSMFLTTFADIVCSGTLSFSKSLLQDIQRNGFYKEEAKLVTEDKAAAAKPPTTTNNSNNSKVANNNTVLFDVSKKVCTTINDIEQAHIQLEGLLAMLETDGLVDLDRVSKDDMSENSADGIYDAQIVTIFQTCYVELRKCLDELILGLANKMSPDICNFVKMMVGEIIKDEEKIMCPSLRKQKEKRSNRKKEKELKICATQEEISVVAQPLLEYLNQRLEVMSEELYFKLFQQTLARTWDTALDTLWEFVKTRLTVRWTVDITINLMMVLHDYFHADGEGIPKARLETDTYRNLHSILSYVGVSTEDLIKRFVEVEVAQEKTDNNETFGEIQIELSVSPTSEALERLIEVKVIEGFGLPRMNTSNEFSDPYVELTLSPSKLDGMVLHENMSLRTSVKKRTLNPKWNERFKFLVKRWNEKLTLSFNVFDFELVCGDNFIGAAVLPVGARDVVEPYLVRLELYRTSSELPYEARGIALLLSARAVQENDKVAAQFVKRRGISKKLETEPSL